MVNWQEKLISSHRTDYTGKLADQRGQAEGKGRRFQKNLPADGDVSGENQPALLSYLRSENRHAEDLQCAIVVGTMQKRECIMPDVHIPQSLFDQIERVVPAATSPNDFVVQAVQEKLSWEGRKGEFYRLSNETRAAMDAKGLSEAAILAEFEAFRKAPNGSDRG